jgi:uncharacterized protein (DUF1330 family)
MTHYLLATVKVNDDSWIPDYGANVHEIVHRHGGKYLSRSANITALEGDPLDASLVALIEFPSMENMQAFMNDADYAPTAAARIAGSDSKLFAIDATDAAGTIPYLAAGG